ncbi:MAG TPA: alkaline phosphatase PhoX [Acidimicrobiales bacterium]|nr:alkaline phosphatase PhoX [Acidimicrobiales bacterium]
MDRRTFLRLSTSTGALVAAGPLLAACSSDGSGSATTTSTASTSTTGASTTTSTTTSTPRPGATRYGPLAEVPDANGLLLPAGFTSELLAVGGETVPGTSYRWHPFPDGGACFATDDGGWVYVSNSEVYVPRRGGAGALRFDAAGRIVDAYRILDGTTMNCAGGTTPWGTWLSCEEMEAGQVWECDPLGQTDATPRPAMGLLRHEMVAADEVRQVLYLTEDEHDGLFYRFRPARWGDLSEGTLEAAAVAADGAISWVPVRGLGDAGTPARYDAPGATPLPGAEGVVVHGDSAYVATKYDDKVSRIDLAQSRLTRLWDGGEPIKGPDNLAFHAPSGNLFACEDGGDMQVVLLTPDGQPDPFLQFVGHPDSEVTGAAFDPSDTRLFVSSQRAPTPQTIDDLVGGGGSQTLGRTYLITGPF